MSQVISFQQINTNKISQLQLAVQEEEYFENSVLFQLALSKDIIIYYAYSKPKASDQQANQAANQQAKPKKKFTFKVGKDKDNKPANDTAATKINIFQIQKNQWKKQQIKGKSPLSRQNYITLQLNENLILIYGGKNIQNKKVLNDIHCFNIQSLTYKKLFSIQCPAAHQNNILIKLSPTKIILVNMKQIWTFELKDIKWELNTNQLPGGVWENLNISLENVIGNQENFIILNGLAINYEEKKQILIYIYEKQANIISTYIINLTQKSVEKLSEISLQNQSQQQNKLKLFCYFVQQKTNLKNNHRKIVQFIHTKTKGIFILSQLDLNRYSIKQLDIKQIDSSDKILNYNINQKQNKIYSIKPCGQNTKKLQLNSYQLTFLHQQQKQPSITKQKNTQSMNYLSNSLIQSIPQQSNESSLIGVKSSKYNNQFENDADCNSQEENYNNYQQNGYVFTDNSEFVERNLKNSNRNSEVNRSQNSERQQQGDQNNEKRVDKNSYVYDNSRQNNNNFHKDRNNNKKLIQNRSEVIIKEQNNQKSFAQNSSYVDANVVKSQQSQQNLYDSNIYTNFNNSNLYQKPHQMQNASSPYQMQLNSTLQKLLVYQHLKRTKLEQKSFILQKSIKKSQTLSKLLTKYASNKQKNKHIQNIKYLKNQLQTIWNKEIFYKKQIDMHFVESEKEIGLRNKESVRESVRYGEKNASGKRSLQKQKTNESVGKINMKKLLRKYVHNNTE